MTDKLFTRDTWRPKSFDEETSSVRVVAVTENPVRIWDSNSRQYIDEVLLVDGFSLPPSGKIPLLDAHNRSSVSSVLGSARRFHPSGNTLECDVFFSGTEAGRNAAQNVKEGHLTDFSVGYFPVESYYIKEGESKDISGRFFRGPVKVTARWNLRELSLTPIGADQYATARSENGTMSSPEGQIPAPVSMPSPQASPPAVSSPEPRQAPVMPSPQPVPQAPAPPQVQSPPAPQPPVSSQNSAPQPPVQLSVSIPDAAPASSQTSAEKPAPPEERAAPQKEKKASPLSGQKRISEPTPEIGSEKQAPPSPKPASAPPKQQHAERDFVDMIFYAFLAIAVLFILKGMFL